jgi:hypothetical protein
MSTSHRQFERLSPEDRVVYKRWLRGGLLVYGTLTALFIFAAFANQIYTTGPDEVAGKTQHAAEVLARNERERSSEHLGASLRKFHIGPAFRLVADDYKPNPSTARHGGQPEIETDNGD